MAYHHMSSIQKFIQLYYCSHQIFSDYLLLRLSSPQVEEANGGSVRTQQHEEPLSDRSLRGKGLWGEAVSSWFISPTMSLSLSPHRLLTWCPGSLSTMSPTLVSGMPFLHNW